MITDDLKAWLESYHPGVSYRMESLSGGCINQVERVVLDDGENLVVKQNSAAAATMFAAEAAGLEAIAQALAGDADKKEAVAGSKAAANKVPAAVGKAADKAPLRTPEAIAVGETYLVLEDLGQGRPDSHYWEDLGRGLARLHRDEQPQFGFSVDNYCGLTPQANPSTDDGYEFFAQHRLLALGRQCQDRGLLQESDMQRLEHMAANLHRWIPKQPPVVVHGDLWSGNIHCCSDGQPALIDPATHWGWAEADLAMTQLFGGFAPAFYQAYAEAAAGSPHWHPDWQDRSSLYNLYHLLNHLLLFGSSYLRQVQAVLRQYHD